MPGRNSLRSPLSMLGIVLIVGMAVAMTACTVEPEPMTDAMREERVRGDLSIIQATRFVPEKPITLYEAMARAVSFNLEHRVREIEAQIAEAELEQSNYDLLPAFESGVGQDRQNRPTSRTTEANIATANVGVAWNIIDLGVSYARAQQQANQVLVAKERQRKAYNDILRDVRLSFWRAASAKRLLRSAGRLSAQIQLAVRYSTELEASQIRDSKVSIAYRRALLDSVRHMVAFRREISDAKTELAELLNIPPGVEFELVEPRTVYAVPSLPMSLNEMEKHALLERAEIRGEDYQKKVDSWRMREQLYELLPGIELNFGGNYSSDNFLLRDTWTTSGIQLGMNLFNLFAIPGRLEAEEKAESLANSRRMAMAVAVMAQVHISYRQHREAHYQFALTQRIAEADRNLTGLARQEAILLEGGFLEAIEAGAREMRTGLEEHRAYVDLIRTHNELMHAVGANEVPANVKDDDVTAIAVSLKRQYAAWDRPAEDADLLAQTSLVALIEAALPSNTIVHVDSSQAPLDRQQPIPGEHPATKSAAPIPTGEAPPSAQLANAPVALGSDFPVTTAWLHIQPPLPPKRLGRDTQLVLAHFVAQVGAFRKRHHAEKTVEVLLGSKDLRGFADLVHTDVIDTERHGALYAVRIGPFFARKEAKGLCDRIRRNRLECIALRQQQMSVAFAVGRY